ncbi:hypothetical protein BB558_006839, partial [Smittium angustum]
MTIPRMPHFADPWQYFKVIKNISSPWQSRVEAPGSIPGQAQSYGVVVITSALHADPTLSPSWPGFDSPLRSKHHSAEEARKAHNLEVPGSKPGGAIFCSFE